MRLESVWIEGATRSGKTTRLVSQFCRWVRLGLDGEYQKPVPQVTPYPQQGRQQVEGESFESIPIKLPQPLGAKQAVPRLLVFAATGDNRIELADRISAATLGQYPVDSTTPLGFFEKEVTLFWPLLIQRLNLRAQFPLQVRPETEQELATRLWRPELDQGILRQEGVSEYRMVRRTLDLLQLAALSGRSLDEIPTVLEQGFGSDRRSPMLWQSMGHLLLRWREWCLERGLLTYGIIAELYWRHLLPDPTYRGHLIRRYQGVLADDVDEYPRIAGDLFEFLLDAGVVGTFTYHPDGGVREGLGADPDYLQRLADRCDRETLNAQNGLQASLGDTVVQLIEDPTLNVGSFVNGSLPVPVEWIQTTSRAQLLRETSEAIARVVHTRQVEPQDIAVIAPGLDPIARYTLREILTNKGVPVESLNDQRPLTSLPVIRALLTLLALVYPGLGRLVDRDNVAEMLLVLSYQPEWEWIAAEWEWGNGEDRENSPFSLGNAPSPITRHPSAIANLPIPRIDPVRAGLLVDHCYAPGTENPRLLPVGAFPRWDRLGYRATGAYNEVLQWIEEQRSQLAERLIPSPLAVLDRAIQQFLWNGSNLPYDRISALRELIETAQHYWDVDRRLRDRGEQDAPEYVTVGQFIQLLRKGTITANPFPVRSVGSTLGSVTLATIFQYRTARQFHRWHFWLDVGSPLWLSGGAANLFAAQLFLQSGSGRRWTPEDELDANEGRLRRILLDLLGRVSDRLILCHSDLATNGQEQSGPLLSLMNAFLTSSPG